MSYALIVFFIFKNHIQKDSLLPKKAVLHPQKTAAANKILMSCAQTVFFIFKNHIQKDSLLPKKAVLHP
jgi:hypothetical protein